MAERSDNVKKKMYVEDLVEGREVKDKFAVRSKIPPKEYTRGWYFRLMIGDRTGDISLVYWGGPEEKAVRSKYERLKVGDVLEVTGMVSSYKGHLQITLNEEHFHGLVVLEDDDYDPEDYMPVTSKNIDQMAAELFTYAESIENEELCKLVSIFLDDEDFMSAFKRAPYSKTFCNNYIGGLLEHTLDDVKMCAYTCQVYPELDRDLLITAAILHDLGKVYEYETTTSIELTREANLIGHTVICERVIRDKIGTIPGFSEDLSLKLSHIILSHHGDYEWGSARSPRMEEAVALHHVDLLNVRLRGFIQAKEELSEEDAEMIYVSKDGVQRPIFKG